MLAPIHVQAAAKTEKALTNVTSEKMVYDSAAQKVTFSGKVKVTHPDFILNSDRLQIFLGESGNGQRPAGDIDAGVVQRIVAESNVTIQLPEGRVATCAKATYKVDDETLTMEGKPAIREGSSQIRGDIMIFYLRENRNEVQGTVEVDFISGDNPTGGEGLGLGNILGGD